MNVRRSWRLLALTAAGSMVWALQAGGLAAHATGAAKPARATGALVSVASPANSFPRNGQNEPSLAVDPVNPGILAVSSNDLVDMQPCSKQASTTAAACSSAPGSFDLGVGMTGVYFSFDKGHSWIQPTYHGLTAAGCDPTVEPCTAKPGPIHTVPNYFENGLGTQGNAFTAFGPVLRNGRFSYANGSRLYVSTLAGNLTGTPVRPPLITSSYTVAVSHIDNPTPARVADQSNWSNPVIVPRQEDDTSFAGEDPVWADNAASSRFFGNVYVCYNDFTVPATGNFFPIYPTVAVSADGGQTWTSHHIAPPIDSVGDGYRLGCAIRTDSHGGVYTFWAHFRPGEFPSEGAVAAQTLVKSVTGGATWQQPVDFIQGSNTCAYLDPIFARCAMEGPAGARSDFGSTPSVDIANGAPTGADATNEIVLTWGDRRFGQNNEAALLSYSRNLGRTWSEPVTVSLPGDRVMYSAAAIAPDGSHVYVTYNAFTTPFTMTMSAPRLEHAILRSAAVGPGGAPVGWTTEFTSPSGDVRGTAPSDFNYGEYLGNIVSAIATRGYGTGAWTDVRHTADCPAMDAWRQASFNAGQLILPAPWPLADCPAQFGDMHLWSATTG
jgi:hypothetical protein